MKKIGITTTVPIEVLLAADYKVIDLNNMFITANEYSKYIDIAERDGFPQSTCAWIKGIYGACISNEIKEVVGVVEGDCSNTKALIEVLKLRGIKVYSFSYPASRKIKDIEESLCRFMDVFGVKLEEAEHIRKRLNKIRELALKLDALTYKENKVSGFENHLYQLSMSDFDGDFEKFEEILKGRLELFEKRQPLKKRLRLGFIGVPPMTADIYEFVEGFDAHFVYNEVQREFAFPRAGEAKNIFEQYCDYTYPYDISYRTNEIKKQIAERRLDGVIHYTQAFCYRAIEDIVIKANLNIPVLNIEGDKANKLDSRTKLRIEAFLDMLLDSY